MTIDTITGDLRAFEQFEPGTFQDFDELSRDQIADPSLLERAFYVSTFPLYTTRGGDPVFALARHTRAHPNNLVLNHLFDEENSSYDQLIKTGNFCPDPDEAQAVLEAADTLQVKLGDLRLSRENAAYRSLGIRTKDGYVRDDREYKQPSEVEQAVIQRVGYTEDFLDMLNREFRRISEIRLYVLAPNYVAVKAGEQFIGRVALRDNFRINANSDAIERSVDLNGSLRGVRRRVVVPSGDAPKNL